MKKRFIAGVVCPRCGAKDTVRLYISETDVQTRDCVDCGYQESLAQQPNARTELPSRVNQTTRTPDRLAETPLQVLTLQ
jgi:uncharacterized metal-binding protein (TIGR02443 family)